MIYNTLDGKSPMAALMDALPKEEAARSKDILIQAAKEANKRFEEAVRNIRSYSEQSKSSVYSHSQTVTSGLLRDAVFVYQWIEGMEDGLIKDFIKDSPIGRLIYGTARAIVEECEPVDVLRGIQMHREGKGTGSLARIIAAGGSIEELQRRLSKANPIYRQSYEAPRSDSLEGYIMGANLRELETEMIQRRVGDQLFLYF